MKVDDSLRRFRELRPAALEELLAGQQVAGMLEEPLPPATLGVHRPIGLVESVDLLFAASALLGVAVVLRPLARRTVSISGSPLTATSRVRPSAGSA